MILQNHPGQIFIGIPCAIARELPLLLSVLQYIPLGLLVHDSIRIITHNKASMSQCCPSLFFSKMHTCGGPVCPFFAQRSTLGSVGEYSLALFPSTLHPHPSAAPLAVCGGGGGGVIGTSCRARAPSRPVCAVQMYFT